MSHSKALQKRVDIVIIGGGPVTLGLLANAMKTNRLQELVNTGDSIAILE
jgi:lysine/ornithine N-monooxygenase